VDIGKKLKALRQMNMLTQEELGNRCDLTKGFISQVERNLTSPSISTFIDLLDCLGTTPTEFFSVVDDKIVFTQDDIFEQEEKNYKIKWLISNAQKNKMEPILLEIEPEKSYKKIEPFEGEEFGYVLSGKLLLRYGKKDYELKKGECFYFTAKVDHILENKWKKKAVILWVSTPPNF
jgi:transcriptional regulator with XRE-family HTH domain